MTQDTAEIGLMTLTERGQNNQLKEEATRCKIDLMTQKELLKGSITRFKTSIRNFHLLEENGLSTQNFSLEISSAYDKLRTELEELVEKWAQFMIKDGGHRKGSSTQHTSRQGDPEKRN